IIYNYKKKKHKITINDIIKLSSILTGGTNSMNEQQLDKVKNGKGFIAALDQSGGSTPKALKAYGVPESAYSNEDEMFDLVHEMRTRIITSPSFDGDK